MQKTIRETLEAKVKELQEDVLYHTTQIEAAKMQIEDINHRLSVKGAGMVK